LFPPLVDHNAKYYLGLLVLHLPHFIAKEKSFRRIWRLAYVGNQEEDAENEDDRWGCTSIQGKRIEIFLKTKRHPKGSPAAMALFQYIKTQAGGPELGVTNEAFWEYLYCYARRSAIRDTRIPSGYEFGPFSLICTVGTVKGQIPHVDVLGPNFQFTLMVTDQTPGTVVYRSTNLHPVNSVKTFLEWLEVPNPTSQIGPVLLADEEMISLLEKYGMVLDCDTPETVIPHRQNDTTALQQGATLSIPGSVIHAGPHCTSFRAMLFYTAHAPDEEAYSSDVQFSLGTLMIMLVVKLFDSPQLLYEDIMLLLKKFHGVDVKYQYELSRHMTDSGTPLRQLMKKWAKVTDDVSINTMMSDFTNSIIQKRPKKKYTKKQRTT
jgi:hypothetical protein